MAVNTPKQAPFPIDPFLTGIAIAYRNATLIADSVLPRVPVGAQTFKWWKYDKAESFTVPETLVGRKGVPNEVEFGATEEESSVKDYGLDDVVPNDDINNAPPGFNPLANAVEMTTDLVVLAREKRVADLVFNNSTYDSTLRETLSGSDQWSHADSDPKGQILEALDKTIVRPNVIVLGQAVYTALRQNPSMVSAFLGNNGEKGTLTRQQIAELFEVEEVIVGQGFINVAKPGQAPSIVRVWGKHAALIHRNRLANTQRGATFGMTAQWGGRIAGQIPEPTIGLRGAVRVRAGESVKELVVAKDLGYFFQNAIA